MFISLFLLYATSFKSIPDILYFYYVRGEGAYMQNITGANPKKSLQNKINLLNERMRIAVLYKEKLFLDEPRSLYAGSITLSCFQIATFCARQLSSRFLFYAYVHLLEVIQCVKSIDSSQAKGIKKRLPMYLLQHKKYHCLYWMIWLACKLHVKYVV